MIGTAVPDAPDLKGSLQEDSSKAGMISPDLSCKGSGFVQDLPIHGSINEDIENGLWELASRSACDVTDQIDSFEGWEFEVIIDCWDGTASMHYQMLDFVGEPVEIAVLPEFDEVCVRSEAEFELFVEMLEESCFNVALEFFGDCH